VEHDDATDIHSVAGLIGNRGSITCRPFRAPHHSVSESGMVGTVDGVRPGELSLAHAGVLFLDQVVDFKRHVIDRITSVARDHKVSIYHNGRNITYPARFQMVMSTPVCPCESIDACVCPTERRANWQNRVERITNNVVDVYATVVPAKATDEHAASSATIAARVLRARERQARRFNAHQDEQTAPLNALLTVVVGAPVWLHLPGQRVARTIADLDGSDVILPRHVDEAISLGMVD
jgi:magnesium chelatase family protein